MSHNNKSNKYSDFENKFNNLSVEAKEKWLALFSRLSNKHTADKYYDGIGVDVDQEEAIVFYKKAAIQGCIESQYKLGTIYYHGYGVPVDYKNARKWFLKSANQNHSHSQNEMGLIYCYGIGVPVDYNEAIKWFELAINNDGNMQAQCNYGNMYQRGLGVKQNSSKAIKLYMESANKGCSDARNKLLKLAKRDSDKFVNILTHN